MKKFSLVINLCFLLLFTSFGQNISNTDTLLNTRQRVDRKQEIVYTTDGATYHFVADKKIDFSNKFHIVFPEGVTVSLIEKRDPITLEAELRVRNNDYQLLFIKGEYLLDYYDSEEDWLSHFLKMILHSQQKTESLSKLNDPSIDKINRIPSSGIHNQGSFDVFLNSVKSLNLESNRLDLMSEKIKEGIELNDQKKLIGFIFGNFTSEENKVKLLNQLIESSSYSKENNSYMMSFIDQLTQESNKVNLLKKLIR